MLCLLTSSKGDLTEDILDHEQEKAFKLRSITIYAPGWNGYSALSIRRLIQ